MLSKAVTPCLGKAESEVSCFAEPQLASAMSRGTIKKNTIRMNRESKLKKKGLREQPLFGFFQ